MSCLRHDIFQSEVGTDDRVGPNLHTRQDRRPRSNVTGLVNGHTADSRRIEVFIHLGVVGEDQTIGAEPTVVSNADQEAMTQDYIILQFEALGYDVEVQEFSFQPWWSESELHSANIIATKPGKIDQTVIVGAHYDSVALDGCNDEDVHTGAGDNASGIGVMLEVAEVLAEYKTHGAIKFVAFGAEELGLWGSFHYASQMTDDTFSVPGATHRRQAQKAHVTAARIVADKGEVE